MDRGPRPSRSLRGRAKECETLLDLIQAARSGRSAVLVIQGEAGIGKTALVDYLAEAASDCRLLRAAGIESEMELPFAGVHQLCSPVLDGLDRLPAPQAEALGTAFGLRAGQPPDRFLIGLAVLTLLSEHAAERPVVCLIDDAQWLDQASAQNLTFVARRLAAEPVVMVFAARTGEGDQAWAGLPQLTIHGLSATDAADLLESAVTTPLDTRVRDRILAETQGNPLALLELPRWYSATELTFGPERTAPATVTRRMEDGFRRRLEPLPPQTRRLLLIAAAEPLGDVGLLTRAGERLGLGMEAASPAEAAGLVRVRSTVRFRHPLVRSAVYHSAEVGDLRAVHRALADVTDPDRDPDRRAWHRAQAATGPDEAVAAELEQSAGRALAQGGLAAAGAFLERAAALTPAGADRADRALNAAQTMVHAGAFDDALRVLTGAEFEVLTDLQRARAEVLRAQIGFASNRGSEALPLLLAAARRLEPLDLELALDTYVGALEASLFAGRLAGEPGALEVAQAARAAPVLAQPRRSDLLLQSIAALHEDGFVAAAPLMKGAARAFETDDLSIDEGLRFMVLAGIAAANVWDDSAWTALASRHLELARESGALIALQFALNSVVYPHLFNGDLVGAAALLDEAEALADVAGLPLHPYASMGLAAFRGNRQQAAPVIEAAADNAIVRGEGLVLAITHWTNALLCNGNRDYAAALAHCREIFASSEDGRLSLLPVETQPGGWALAELVEAAARADEPATATVAADLLSEVARVCGTDWALGMAARSEALLRDGDHAEDLYREAIDRLGRTNIRVELARARLLYGEWLRRVGRRTDAREVLRQAHESLAAMGVEAFAERTRQELAATGERVRRRTVQEHRELTAQELHIARLAADGRTNAEIGTELYLSRHTVEWHMRKVFAKLNVTSRRQLRGALASPLA
ncbi:regulatory LuxR family protein [Kribbella antiqua]|uniref:Regulatory LuxR family protein n=1 Tax=Kribbella antiqua TaxID=2512217 RepID=A0A4R2I153_9ACTN|nr:LuxR family transcriptional regulator [Kribbella antiqua]TCO37642.1 regulatory LuxR family protein [Kribbella antiqua]